MDREKKRVMLIDDTPEVLDTTVGMVRAFLPNVRVFSGLDLYDADSYVYDQEIRFDLMIIDLALGNYEFDDPTDREALAALGDNKEYLVGWIWIKRFLRAHKEFDPNRIIVVSAYTDLLDLQEIESSGVRVIDKRARDSARLLLKLIQYC